MRLAWKNIMARKMTTAKVMVSMVFMIIIMCVFTAYSVAIGDESTDIIESYRAGHYLSVYTGSQELSKQKKQELLDIDGVGYVTEYGAYNNRKGLESLEFVVDGRSYSADGVYNQNDGIITKMYDGGISFVEGNTSIMTANDLEEMNYRWLNASATDYGVDKLDNPNDIILSTYLIDELGLSGSIVGKSITIKYGGKSYKNLKVVGIASKELYKLTANMREHIIARYDSPLAQIGTIKHTAYVYLDNFMQVKMIAKQMMEHRYGLVNVGTEYGISMATTITIIGSLLVAVMTTIGLAIIGALTLNIVISMRYMIIKKANFYGILSAYGMKDRGVFNVLFFEMMFVALLAGVVAYIVSYALLYLLDFIIATTLGIGVIFSWANFVITLAVALIFTMIVVMAVTIINYMTFLKKNTAKLLNKSSVD